MGQSFRDIQKSWHWCTRETRHHSSHFMSRIKIPQPATTIINTSNLLLINPKIPRLEDYREEWVQTLTPITCISFTSILTNNYIHVSQIQTAIQPKPTSGNCQTTISRQRTRKVEKQVSVIRTVTPESKNLRGQCRLLLSHNTTLFLHV